MLPIHLEAMANDRITRLTQEAGHQAPLAAAGSNLRSAPRRSVSPGGSTIDRWLARLPIGFRPAAG
jgi:hypothetical protein